MPFIKHGDAGIDVGNGTNGGARKNRAGTSLPHMGRFTVAAGRPSTYASMMYKGPEHTEVFDRAMANIKYAVDLKRRKSLPVTLGIQMVLMPGMGEEILPFAQLGIDLGVDYAVIKHCSDDEQGSLAIDYSRYDEMYSLLEKAEAM